MTDIWAARGKSEELLERSLKVEAQLLTSLFETIDRIVILLECNPRELAARVTALTLLKAKRLGLGIYSLALDCLGQEAGALFRVLQESWEFLSFLRQDPSRAARVIESGPPKAGQIAKQIDSQFKEMRDYLNAHASHLALSYHSMAHLVDDETSTLRLTNRPSERVLRQNLAALFGVLLMSAGEALQVLPPDHADWEALAHELDDLRTRGYDQFRMDIGRSDSEGKQPPKPAP